MHTAQGEATVIDARFGPAAEADESAVREGCPPSQQPVFVARDAVAVAAGSLPLFLDGDSFGRLFPRAAARLPRTQAAVLLATTRLVGVHCPGMHSIFSELTLDFTGDGQSSAGEPSALGYRVVQYDARMGLVRLQVDAPRTSGTIRAFFRPAPATQPTATELRPHVEPSEFAGRRALVVGGSRGLGALSAKLLAAGGADVVLTYLVGASDAQEVAAETAQVGALARTMRLDVRDQDDVLRGVIEGLAPFTHLYYFATAPIFVARRGHFNPDLFGHFCEVYVNGFVKLVRALLPFGLRVAFYPSSIAVAEAPIDMGEYAAAKAAGEAACRFLEKAHPGLTVLAPRLPRLPTDQTRSLLAVRDEDPVAHVLGALRQG
jgi:NAD(P)-dependent dehydrogenase (short-subunit alcohol dehydrogenase family)